MALTREDREQLNLIRLGFYAMGVLALLAPCFATGFLAFMSSLPSANRSSSSPAPFLMLFAAFAFAMYWVMAALSLYAGWCVQKRQNHTLVLVTSIATCAFGPLGLALGVFSLLVITRSSVKDSFRPSPGLLATLSPDDEGESSVPVGHKQNDKADEPAD